MSTDKNKVLKVELDLLQERASILIPFTSVQITGSQQEIGSSHDLRQLRHALKAFERISKDAGRAILFLDGAEPCGPEETQLTDDRKTVRKILSEYGVMGIPAGWKPVPIEPSEAMVSAILRAMDLPLSRKPARKCARFAWDNALWVSPEFTENL